MSERELEDCSALTKQLGKTNDIHAALSASLDELFEKSPDRFTTPICILPTIDSDLEREWEQRFLDARQADSGSRIALIPYKLNDLHWIGILLEFENNEQLLKAQFIDPVSSSEFCPDRLQKTFARHFPGHILHSGSFLKHEDPAQSARLTITNLLKAAERREGSIAGNAVSNRLGSISNNVSQVKVNLTGRQPDLDVTRSDLTYCEGKTTEHCATDRHSSNMFDRNSSLLTSESHHESISQQHKQRLATSNELKPKEDVAREEYRSLKTELERRLAASDISDAQELETQIAAKRDEIETLEKAGKPSAAQKRRGSLLELEQLLELAGKVKALAPRNLTDSRKATTNNEPSEEYRSLKTELERRLAASDISDAQELETQIAAKRDEIETLEKAGKPSAAQKRRGSLSELEQLLELAEKVRALAPKNLTESRKATTNNEPSEEYRAFENGVGQPTGSGWYQRCTGAGETNCREESNGRIARESWKKHCRSKEERLTCWTRSDTINSV